MAQGGDGPEATSTRRRYLERATVAAVVGLSGCLGFSGGDGAATDEEPGGTPTPATTDTETGAGTGTPTATPGDATAETPTGAAGTPTPEPLVDLSGDYPGHRGGSDRRAFAPGAAAPRSGAAVAYALDLPTAVFQPVVAGTTLYLARRRRGSDGPTVGAVDLRRGTRLWSRTLGAGATGPPSVAGGRLFVPTWDGTHALEPDGTVVWETDAGAGTAFVPAVTDERVFVAGRRSLTAFAHDGTEAWTLPLSVRPLASPAAHGAAVYLALPRESGERDLVAFDAASGASRWRRPVEVDAGVVPVVAGDAVYATSSLVQGGVTALATDGGDRLWRGEVRPTRPPAVTDDRVVAAGRTLVRAYDAAGTVAWETDLGTDVVAGPVASDDTAYVVVRGDDAATVLLAFGTAAGGTRWSLATDRPLDVLPAVVDGGLVAATRDDESGTERLFVVAGV